MSLAIKRIVDFVAATIGLVLLAPCLMIVAVLVWLSMGSPVIFRQLRPGYKGRPFTIYKFRTMREAHAAKGGTLPDADRLTAFGRLLRTTSLDEAPELWNVVKGEMSLVGPRPLLMAYLERYSPEQARRHEVMPGITGWAQVNGRNAITWEQRFEYDVWYVDHWSLWLDLRILVATVGTVLKREGISQAGAATMEEFRGAGDQRA